MSSRPEVQARAHAELDTVIGRDYWPTAEDEQSLPYIRAIIKEVRPSGSTGRPPILHLTAISGAACAPTVLDGGAALLY
jgi:Cytochrome P450